VSDVTSRNFTLRLAADDQARLERLAEQFSLDRTASLRRLIRRAVPFLTAGETAVFIPITHLHSIKGSLPVRLRLKGGKP